MKEIGMKKLIELLKDQHGEVVTYNIQSDGGYMFHICGFAVREERLLSKKFGFIKWLVENDKIDIDPIRTRVKRVYVELEPREFTPQDFTDRVIMLLSISDTPIEDLLLYLK